MRYTMGLLAAVSTLGLATLASPAIAAPGDPVTVAEGVTLDPIIEIRVRYENVDTNGPAEASALTTRMRAGAELKAGGFFVLAEGEGTLAAIDDYDDKIPDNNGYPGAEPFPVVPDPQSIELNRAQVGYMKNGTGLTVGRQRVILDNARFVGNVGWRQNEQTFDAVRAQGKFGPVTFDGTYAVSQRSIFGSEALAEPAGGNFARAMDGDMILLNGGVKTKPVTIKAFGYLIDYDSRVAFSSQTYGVLATGSIPLGGKAKIDLLGSYARQFDYGANVADYAADYINAEAGGSIAGFGLKAGYEKLGSDGGVAAFQTPLATLHAFNGWADVFLTTPANGLQDFYLSASRKVALPGAPAFTATVAYHKFESDFGSIDYGEEIDAQIGLKAGPVALLAKFARFYSAGPFADVRKIWFSAEVSY